MTIAFRYQLLTGSWVYVSFRLDRQGFETTNGPGGYAIPIPYGRDRKVIEEAAARLRILCGSLNLEGKAMTISFPHLLSTGSWVHVTLHADSQVPEILSGPGADTAPIPYDVLSHQDQMAIEGEAAKLFIEHRKLMEKQDGEGECA